MQILWDEPKRLANLDKHGIDFADLGPAFFETALIRQARKPRRQAVGRLQGTIVTAIFVQYGDEAISLVSLRVANATERKHFLWQAN